MPSSQSPASCANESYYTLTPYSTTDMLTAGQHTLWHGVLAMQSVVAAYTGWIKCVRPPSRNVRYLKRLPGQD